MSGLATDAPGGRLADNLVQFGRLLRRAGLPVGPATVIEAIRAVETVGLSSREDVYWTLHSVFVTKRDQSVVFEEAFRLFWRRGNLAATVAITAPPTSEVRAPPRAAEARVARAFFGEREEAAAADERVQDVRLAASTHAVLQRRDFAQMSAEEIAEAEARIARMTLVADRVATRRLVAAKSGAIDPRRTLRQALRTGGAFAPLAHRRPAERLPPIVALCDISGSMSAYSRILLHFLHALGARRRVEAFLFGTGLTNVTRPLRHRDADAALAACSTAVDDWSGGTRIASALADFNRLWSRRVLGQGAIVLLITDGLERDQIADLGLEMDRLHRSCRRLIWLNPLLRFDGFEPRARGVRAMLPHVDEFRPVHSLAAVADLVAALAGEARSTGDPLRYEKAA